MVRLHQLSNLVNSFNPCRLFPLADSDVCRFRVPFLSPIGASSHDCRRWCGRKTVVKHNTCATRSESLSVKRHHTFTSSPKSRSERGFSTLCFELLMHCILFTLLMHRLNLHPTTSLPPLCHDRKSAAGGRCGMQIPATCSFSEENNQGPQRTCAQ